MEKGKRQKVIRMKTHQGSIRQKTPGGPYYYRVTIRKGLPRKEFPLKTNDPDKAKKLVADLAAVLEAQTQEVALAQINAIKGFSKQAMNLPLSEAWSKYEVHPNRATPHTTHHTPHTTHHTPSANSWPTSPPTRSLSNSFPIRCRESAGNTPSSRRFQKSPRKSARNFRII